MVFQKFLETLRSEGEMVRCLFTKHLMACLMNQAAKEDRYLHRAAIKALKAVEGCVSAEPKALPVVLECLLGENGAYNFDQRTNTKTVDKLMNSISMETEQAVLQVIKHPITSLPKKDIAEGKLVLRSYIDYLSKALAASTSLSRGSDLTHAAASSSPMKQLSALAFSQPADIPSELLTSQIKELCQSRLHAR